MAVVPITINGVLYDKTARTTQAVLISGTLSIQGLTVGGGPILPPDEVPPDVVDPPLVIWGGPIDPYPDHGLPMPQPPFPPDQPPSQIEKPHPGWNWKPSTPDSPQAGWYYVYVPAQGSPSPKDPLGKK